MCGAARSPQLLPNRLGERKGVVKHGVPLRADGGVEIEPQAVWFQPKDLVSRRRKPVPIDPDGCRGAWCGSGAQVWRKVVLAQFFVGAPLRCY